MKGNQESMLYTTNATVAALNHVSGFDWLGNSRVAQLPARPGGRDAP